MCDFFTNCFGSNGSGDRNVLKDQLGGKTTFKKTVLAFLNCFELQKLIVRPHV